MNLGRTTIPGFRPRVLSGNMVDTCWHVLLTHGEFVSEIVSAFSSWYVETYQKPCGQKCDDPVMISDQKYHVMKQLFHQLVLCILEATLLSYPSLFFLMMCQAVFSALQTAPWRSANPGVPWSAGFGLFYLGWFSIWCIWLPQRDKGWRRISTYFNMF